MYYILTRILVLIQVNYSFFLNLNVCVETVTAFPYLKLMKNAESCFHLKSESVMSSSDNINGSVLSVSFFSE